jgi:hypothetical protein
MLFQHSAGRSFAVSSTESNLTLRNVGAGWKYQSGYVLRTSEVCITQAAASAHTDAHPNDSHDERARVMHLPGSYVARSRSVEQLNWDIDAKVGEIAEAIPQQVWKVNDLCRRGIGRHLRLEPDPSCATSVDACHFFYPEATQNERRAPRSNGR